MTLTYAEKASKLYDASELPTNPAEVNSQTSLQSLNLNWSESQLSEKERTKHVHRLHPYLGKFIPQLVEVFLRKYFRKGHTVLDPFSGSGTTLVQAIELGINSVGYDVSAFNVLLSRVKTARYDLKVARKEIADILEKTKLSLRKNHRQPSFWESEAKPSVHSVDVNMDYLKRWFAPQALTELLTFLGLIRTEGYKYERLLKVILCRSARSARLTTHFDLDFPKEPQTTPYWCYKHSRECYPTTEAFKFIERYSFDSARRIERFAGIRQNARVLVRHSDSRKASFPKHDGVITSPPYVGLIDYHEQHAYAYALLGLHDKRLKEIGPAVNGSSQKASLQYKKDIAEVFRRAAASMTARGRIIVVANDRANLYEEIAREANLDVEGIVTRHVNRRTGRRSNQFFESIFVWRLK